MFGFVALRSCWVASPSIGGLLPSIGGVLVVVSSSFLGWTWDALSHGGTLSGLVERVTAVPVVPLHLSSYEFLSVYSYGYRPPAEVGA